MKVLRRKNCVTVGCSGREKVGQRERYVTNNNDTVLIHHNDVWVLGFRVRVTDRQTHMDRQIRRMIAGRALIASRDNDNEKNDK